MIKSNHDEFWKWYRDFVRNKHRSTIHIDKSWPGKVDDAHQELREVLGGVSRTEDIVLKNVQAVVPFQMHDALSYELLLLIPKYFHEYAVNRTYFKVPVREVEPQKDVRHGKHIQHWMTKNQIDKETVQKVNNIVSKLGGIWSNYKTQNLVLKVKISTDPKDFALLGHRTVDPQSCFKHGGCNQVHKYILGASDHTFVCLVGCGPQFEDQDSVDLLARTWGFASADLDMFSIYNYYAKQEINQGNILQAISGMFAKVLGVETPHCDPNVPKLLTVYQNKGFGQNYRKSADVKIPAERSFDSYYANARFDSPCYKCTIHFIRDDIEVIEGKFVCSHCVQELPRCEYSGKRSIQPLINALGPDGNVIKISPAAVASGDFYTCNVTGTTVHKNNAVRATNGYWMAKTAAIEYGYSECPDCHYYLHWRNKADHMCSAQLLKPARTY